MDFDAVAQASCKFRVKHVASEGGTARTVRMFYKKVQHRRDAGNLSGLSASNQKRAAEGVSAVPGPSQ